MTLLEIAQIYTDLVKAERATPDTEPHAKDQLNVLRTKYHELLMEVMKREGVEFSDRFDVARQAFEMVSCGLTSHPLAGTTVMAEDEDEGDE